MDIDPLDTSQGGGNVGSHRQAPPSATAPSNRSIAQNPPAIVSALYNGFAPRPSSAHGQGQGQPQAPLARARSRSSTSSASGFGNGASGSTQTPAQQQYHQHQQQQLRHQAKRFSQDGEMTPMSGSPGLGWSGSNADGASATGSGAGTGSRGVGSTNDQPRRTSYGNLNTPPSPREPFRPEHAFGSSSPAKAGKLVVSGFAPLGNPVSLGGGNRPGSSPTFRSNLHLNTSTYGNERRSSLAHSLRLHSISPVSPAEGVDPSFPPGSRNASRPPNPSVSHPVLSFDPLDRGRSGPSSPRSAPPSPSAASILHPPTFIHTHHPRRASLVPLNLNLISPMPPSPDVQEAVRRESSVFSAGFVIGSGTPSPSGGPGKWTPREMAIHGFARRRSLTPSMATLAPASPTKLLASGSIVRATGMGMTEQHTTRNLSPGQAKSKSRPSVSAEGWGAGPAIPFGHKRLGPGSILAQDAYGRRASQPTVTAAAPLATEEIRRRPSSDKGLLYNLSSPVTPAATEPPMDMVDQDGFTFGGGVDRGSVSSARCSPTTSASGASSTAESEAAEAERQRLAFMRAGVGQGVRLSFGGVRRQSHLREEVGMGILSGENIRRDSLGLAAYAGFGIAPTILTSPLAGDELARGGDGRRGSIPISIPYEKRSRETTSVSSASIAEDDDDGDDGYVGADSKRQGPGNHRAERVDSDVPTLTGRRHTLQRPLPPLMPLSDPGRDMLASTLALHRATHMLESKNLRSEPLPHPLPPSLHPPAPVNISDFDIDFILQGAVDPYGIETGVDGDSIAPRTTMGQPAIARSMPVPRNVGSGAGPELEDSFAKFVGAHDEEYDDRRGEWTFRSCAATLPTPNSAENDSTGSYWHSPGAGKYLITAKAEVVAQTSGRAWRLRRVGAREYELDDVASLWGGVSGFPSSVESKAALLADGLVLTTKANHINMGGLKFISSSRKSAWGARRARIESEDSVMTARVAKLVATKAGFNARSGSMELPNGLSAAKRGRGEKVSFLEARRKSKSQESPPSPTRVNGSREVEVGKEDRKKDRSSIGDKIKRSWLGGLSKPGHSGSNAEEKRQRRQDKEKAMQSHSWSGGSSSGSLYSQASSLVNHSTAVSFGSKGSQLNNNVSPEANYQPPWLLLSEGVQPGSETRLGDADRPRVKSESGIEASKPMLGLGIEDETNSGLGWKEGRAWKTVPAEALAMVVPLCAEAKASEGSRGDSRPQTADSLGLGNSKALLVYYVPFSPSVNQALATDGQREGKDTFDLGQHPEGTVSRKTGSLTPLPFQSFRIVGNVVTSSDLRSDPEMPSWPDWETRDFEGHEDSPEFSPIPSEPVEANSETSPNLSIASSTPSVIAVCHSLNQGVEFVLEGLDRLGLCQGKSAWGPDGYEEWRGSGLSAEGRQVLDVIWSGCVAVLELHVLGQV